MAVRPVSDDGGDRGAVLRPTGPARIVLIAGGRGHLEWPAVLGEPRARRPLPRLRRRHWSCTCPPGVVRSSRRASLPPAAALTATARSGQVAGSTASLPEDAGQAEAATRTTAVVSAGRGGRFWYLQPPGPLPEGAGLRHDDQRAEVAAKVLGHAAAAGVKASSSSAGDGMIVSTSRGAPGHQPRRGHGSNDLELRQRLQTVRHGTAAAGDGSPRGQPGRKRRPGGRPSCRFRPAACSGASVAGEPADRVGFAARPGVALIDLAGQPKIWRRSPHQQDAPSGQACAGRSTHPGTGDRARQRLRSGYTQVGVAEGTPSSLPVEARRRRNSNPKKKTGRSSASDVAADLDDTGVEDGDRLAWLALASPPWGSHGAAPGDLQVRRRCKLVVDFVGREHAGLQPSSSRISSPRWRSGAIAHFSTPAGIRRAGVEDGGRSSRYLLGVAGRRAWPCPGDEVLDRAARVGVEEDDRPGRGRRDRGSS